MTAYEAWQQVNDRYLTEAIARIRARLEALANKPRDAIADVPPPAPAERSRWHTWWNGETASPDRAIEPAATITEEALATTPAPADAEGTPIPAAEMLAARLGLNAFERDVLLLCAAMEFDTRIGLLCAQAQGDPAKTYPTFGLALAMLSGSTARARTAGFIQDRLAGVSMTAGTTALTRTPEPFSSCARTSVSMTTPAFATA